MTPYLACISPVKNDPDESIQYEVLTVNPIPPSKYTELDDKSQNDAILSQLVQVIAQKTDQQNFKVAPNG